jgi:hypothetical protein
MSDIGGIFTPFDLVLMALVAGSPGALAGLAVGAWRWRARRVLGALIGAAVGFVLCLGAVLVWMLAIK